MTTNEIVRQRIREQIRLVRDYRKHAPKGRDVGIGMGYLRDIWPMRHGTREDIVLDTFNNPSWRKHAYWPRNPVAFSSNH